MDNADYDDVVRWLTIRCEFPPMSNEGVRTLYHDYLCWGAAQIKPGHVETYRRRARHMGRNTFSAILREIGLEFTRRGMSSVIGIRLVDANPWGAPAHLPQIPSPAQPAHAATSAPDDFDDLPLLQ